MPSQKKPDDPSQKKPANAFKHGIFAAVMIAPGEDPEEFEELHAELVREWEPDWATETDRSRPCKRPLAKAQAAEIPPSRNVQEFSQS